MFIIILKMYKNRVLLINGYYLSINGEISDTSIQSFTFNVVYSAT